MDETIHMTKKNLQTEHSEVSDGPWPLSHPVSEPAHTAMRSDGGRTEVEGSQVLTEGWQAI